MPLLNKILLTALFSLCIHSAKTQDILQLWYPNQVNILPNCNIQPFEKSIPITTNSKIAVKLYSFKPNSDEYILYHKGKEVRVQDTISLTETNPAIFTAKFKKTPRNQDSLYLLFETSIDSMEIFKKGTIQLLFKKYVIPRNEITPQNNQTVELSKSCLDSINVYFPFGGTETSISLYKNSTALTVPIKSIWYQFGEIEKNYITFSRKDIGKYFVLLTSCWWGAGFWITIK